MGEVEVGRTGRYVTLRAWSGYEGEDQEELEPDEADAVAAKLTRYATEVRTERAVLKALCATEGHRWDEGFDAHGNRPGEKVHIRHCERCEERVEAAGWRNEYPPRKHRRPLGYHLVEVDCYGPGCPDCDAEGLGAAVADLLARGAALLDGDGRGE